MPPDTPLNPEADAEEIATSRQFAQTIAADDPDLAAHIAQNAHDWEQTNRL